MSPSQRNSDHPTESKRPRMRSESRRVEEGEFDSSEFTDQIQQEAEGELRGIPRFDFSSSEVTRQVQHEVEGEFKEIPELVTDSSSDEEQFDQHQEDTMLYPYPKYHDEADAEAHICAFLRIWQANHVLQRFSEAQFDLPFQGTYYRSVRV